MSRVMDCPHCDTSVIGESLDLLEHVREEHPREDASREVLFGESFEERFRADP